LDEFEWKHNLFLEYHNPNKLKSNKVVIMPLEIIVRFYGALKQGAGSTAGPNQ